MPYANRRDANEKKLIQFARKCGAWVIQMRPGQGFDLLIVYRDRAHIVEIKDGSKPLSARRLTDDEQELKNQCEYRNVPYHLIETEDDFLRLLAA